MTLQQFWRGTMLAASLTIGTVFVWWLTCLLFTSPLLRVGFPLVFALNAIGDILDRPECVDG